MDATRRKTRGNLGLHDLFFELLEGQFPVLELQPIKLRCPSDFASVLNVHVNHLNRAVKSISHVTTTQAINEKMTNEAKRLLEKNEWNILEIALSLGFKEASHFSNFFKKQVGVSPTTFRGTNRI